MAEDSNLIASFQKNSQEEFRFSITDFKGHEYADIRIFYEKDGDFFPSKKGITVSLDTWKDFKECIEKLETELQGRDLLPADQPADQDDA